jgi:hypothetical protein
LCQILASFNIDFSRQAIRLTSIQYKNSSEGIFLPGDPLGGKLYLIQEYEFCIVGLGPGLLKARHDIYTCRLGLTVSDTERPLKRTQHVRLSKTLTTLVGHVVNILTQ